MDMDATNVTLSIAEIIQMRTSIRARLRELNRMLKHYHDLPGVEDDKAVLEPLYEKLGNAMDQI